MPLLKLVTPQLAQVITKISHKHVEFTPEEGQCLQNVIDYVLYGMDPCEFHTTWVSDAKKALTLLFVLNDARGDMVRVKEACVKSVTQSIARDAKIGDLLQHMVRFQIRLQQSSQQQNNTTPIGQLLEYCLGVISQKGIDPTSYFSSSDLNEEVLRILSTTVPRTALDIREEPNVTPKHPRVKCHKTILCTSSPLFNAQFSHSPSHIPTAEPYSHEMIHLIHYCYGILNSIPLSHQMPLIALAKMHQMNDLSNRVMQQVNITTQSFMPLVTTMDKYEMEWFGADVVDRLVQFAVVHKKEVITMENYDEIPRGLMKWIVMALVGGEEVAKGHVTP